MNAWNLLARMAAVPLITGVASTLVFLILGALVGGDVLEDPMEAAPVFLAVGAVVGAVVGCPLVCVLDDLLWRIRGKYVFGGAGGAVLGWLVLEGAFVGGAWQEIWTNPIFWQEWAPRRLLLFGVIGVLSGSLYTLMVMLIDRMIPRNVQTKWPS